MVVSSAKRAAALGGRTEGVGPRIKPSETPEEGKPRGVVVKNTGNLGAIGEVRSNQAQEDKLGLQVWVEEAHG